jgi:hypothetical protein
MLPGTLIPEMSNIRRSDMDRMTKSIQTRIAVVVMAMGVLTGAASAQLAPAQVTIDENGNGTWFGAPMPGTMMPDPTTGLNSLTYLPPVSLTQFIMGDLVITEPIPGTALLVSDVVRFHEIVTPNGVPVPAISFYSDLPENAAEIPDLADVGLPNNTLNPFVILPEVGTEGNNWVDYAPTPNDPGFIAGLAAPVTYHIVSDIPEPATLSLLVLGGLALLRKRKG